MVTHPLVVNGVSLKYPIFFNTKNFPYCNSISPIRVVPGGRSGKSDIVSYLTRVLKTVSVWEGARHGDYGSFRFQMSHKKMLDGDFVPLHFLNLETFPCTTNAGVRVLSHSKFCKGDIVSSREKPSRSL